MSINDLSSVPSWKINLAIYQLMPSQQISAGRGSVSLMELKRFCMAWWF